MASFSVETVAMEQKQKESVERSHWVLDAPEPPGLVKEFISSIKETISPSESSSRKTPSRRALSFLQGVFPILIWGRGYKASMFKSDLLAGLTLASLCIPQVAKYTTLATVLFIRNAITDAHIKIFLQSIGYANLAKLDPQYGLCEFELISEYFFSGFNS